MYNSTLNVTSTVTIALPTSEAASTSASASGSNTNVWIGLASAGGFTLLLAVVGLLICLKHTRTKHRRRIEDMERRINGLESYVRPPPARRIKRFSTATGTSLGSSWGAWRSKDVKNFQKLRTANQPTKNEYRKSFGHSWWAFSPQPSSGERKRGASDQSQTAALLQKGTALETITPPQTGELHRVVTPTSAALRLSAIAECPSPARGDSPMMTSLHHRSVVAQPQTGGSQASKEISVIQERGRSPSPKYSTSQLNKELAVDKEYGSNKTIAERRRAPSPTSIPTKIHQRKPAIVGTISVFPPPKPTEFGHTRSALSQSRPFSVINEDPTAPPQRSVPPAPAARKPTSKRPSRGLGHLRNVSYFSDDSSMGDDTPGFACSSSSLSCSNWPFDLRSPKIDYGQSSGPTPRFKQHESPLPEVGEPSDRLQNLTTFELDVSTFAKFESASPRAIDRAASYRALVENEGEATMVETVEPGITDPLDQKDVILRLEHSQSTPILGGKAHFSIELINNHASLPAPPTCSSMASSTRSSNGNPFHWDPAPRANSVQTTSTSCLKDAKDVQQYLRPRARTDPSPKVPTSVPRSECGQSTAGSVSTKEGPSRTWRKDALSRNRSATRPALDLSVAIPTPTLHHHPLTFYTPIMPPLPRCQFERKVEPVARPVEAARITKPVFKSLDWKQPSHGRASYSPPRAPDCVSPSRHPSRTESRSDRVSRDKDEETYNILSGLPPCRPPPRRKHNRKHNLMGSSELLPSVTESSSRTTSVKSFSESDDFQKPRPKKNNLMGSTERFPVITNDSLRATNTAESVSDTNTFESPRLTTLNNLRYESRSDSPPLGSLPCPPPPSTIDSDLDPAITRSRIHRTRGALPTTPSGIISHLNDPIATCFAQKKMSLNQYHPFFPSPTSTSTKNPRSPKSPHKRPPSSTPSTTPSELEALETNQLLLKSFPPLPTTQRITSSSASIKTKTKNPFTTRDAVSEAEAEAEANRSNHLSRISNEMLPTLTPGRQGFGPGPSLSLLEKWERQGRSYITTHTALTEEEDCVIPRGRKMSPRGRDSEGGVNVYPPPESTRRRVREERKVEAVPTQTIGGEGGVGKR